MWCRQTATRSRLHSVRTVTSSSRCLLDFPIRRHTSSPKSPRLHPRKQHPDSLRRQSRPSPQNHFADVQVPTALFNEKGVSVLPAGNRDQRSGARFLILDQREQLKSPPKTFRGPQGHEGSRMLSYIQTLVTPTADTFGSCYLLHFDNKRYIFGNIAEGTQRAMVQRKVSMLKVGDVFMTGPVNWKNAGGLLGLLLTVADTHKGADEARSEHKKSRVKGKPEVIGNPSRLNIHGGKNITYLLATCRNFIFRSGFPLNPLEIRHDARAAEPSKYEPDWKDSNINVWYMPIDSVRPDSTSPRKRSRDEFEERNLENKSSHNDEESPEASSHKVVMKMFNSDWKLDALIETTLHQAKLPATLFVRDDQGHLQKYEGPLPGGGRDVPDIPVLVRRPWPKADIDALPSTKPSTQSMCYIVKSHERRGRFDPEKADSLGVAMRDRKLLSDGKSVTGKDGATVTPDMVLDPSVPGNGFAIVELPDESYIERLIARPEWTNSHIMKGIERIYWTLGQGVVNDTRLRDFMQSMPSVKHVVASVDNCPNMISAESAALQSCKLHLVDPDRFPIPQFSNKLSVTRVPVAPDAAYETDRTGKYVQLAPHHMEREDMIVPFRNFAQWAYARTDNDIKQMAGKAKEKVRDPTYLAKVEQAESDIPNRDAEIITLGTGSAIPSKYRNVSATLVRVPGYGNYLLDAGENTLGQMRRVFGDELPQVLRDLKLIWISHLHADHHLGTVSVIKAWHEETSKSDPSAELRVASHSNMIDWLREYASVEEFGHGRLVFTEFGKPHPERRPFQQHVMRDGRERSCGLTRIDAAWVSHCYGALAVVLTFPTGLRVAYSGDCRPSDAFVEIGRGATLLIHESTFDDALAGDARAKKHSTTSEAVGVGRRMGARRVLLTHFSQRYQKLPNMVDVRAEPPPVVGGQTETEKGKKDEVVLVAFDYMRVRLGDFRKAQAFVPAVQKMFDDMAPKGGRGASPAGDDDDDDGL
ncbi:hypothetical protein GGR56DRAFT_624947 [Xylariaceae sp. FL0804]|nr:hypothetical protein GGR56DRAFT_624947 [Xylariaceae sp. FL0804]